MSAPSSSKLLMVNPFTSIEVRLLFARSLDGVSVEDITSGVRMKLGDKGLHHYRMMTQYVARDDSGLSLTWSKDATVFLRWIMSVIPDAVIQAGHRRATNNRALENRVSSVIPNEHQNAGTENIDEFRRFSNKKFDGGHDVHCAIIEAEEDSKPFQTGRIPICLWAHGDIL